MGQRVQPSATAANIKPKKVEMVVATLVDTLPADDMRVLVAVSSFAAEPFTRLERLDIYSGRRTPVARAPVRTASFVVDNKGQLRFAIGAGIDNVDKLYYRIAEAAEWKLINDESVTDRREYPIGFSADDSIAYLQVEQAEGPDAIVAMDIATGTRTQVLRDNDVDPSRIIYRPSTSTSVGVVYMDGKPRTEFFDAASPEARMYRMLEDAFQGEAPFVTSTTADGSLALVQTTSDRNPGDFYVFDVNSKKADHLISRRTWFDPGKMAEMRPLDIPARDGLVLKSYLTLPHGKPDRGLPMVVLAHGGPFGIYDGWGFDDNAQMLAAAGYAVLQVNFRGSGNRGREFTRAGARQWGGKMQDDLTDATRWAIEQGFADPAKICIQGASYGAYAALTGVVREPDLYRCAVGYVGVYDLPMMHTAGDIQKRGSGATFLKEWIGDSSELASVSPTRLAGRIKVPVFLVAGGEDERAPIAHSRMMEQAIGNAGGSVETLYFPTEGHGFFLESSRREYYTRLLAFLARSLGGTTARAQASK